MAKDPAFLFYPKDWLEGTAEFFPNEKGVYIDLLSHQHQKGDLPNDTLRLAKIVGVSHDEFLKIWGVLKEKFQERDGRFINTKLTGVTKERSDKGLKNTVIGTFASLLRGAKLERDVYEKIRKEFKVDDFLTESTENTTERLSKWFSERLKSIKDANAIGNEDASINITTDIKNPEIQILTFESISKELLNSGTWIEKTAMHYKITADATTERLTEFLKIIDLKEDWKKPLKEIKAHFVSWLKIELKQQTNGKKPFKTDREHRTDELTNLKAGSAAFLNRNKPKDDN